MRKKLVSFVTAAAAVAVLAGCSTGASSDHPGTAKTTAAAKQSKAQACAKLEDEFKAFVEDQGSSSAPADPKARAALVSKLNDRLDATLPDITNPTVKSAFEHFNSSSKRYATALSAGDATSADAQQAEADVQSSLKEVTAACPS